MKYAGRFFRKKDMVEQLVGDLQVDVSKARRVLGWTPSETMKQALDRLRVKK
jgi:nucleoside-diphosphate-sugar epimerase